MEEVSFELAQESNQNQGTGFGVSSSTYDSEGSYSFEIPSSALTTGIYMLLLKDINGTIHRCKVLIP